MWKRLILVCGIIIFGGIICQTYPLHTETENETIEFVKGGNLSVIVKNGDIDTPIPNTLDVPIYANTERTEIKSDSPVFISQNATKGNPIIILATENGDISIKQ
jgi:hypothetical protein